MPKVTIDDSKGLVQSSGSGLEVSGASSFGGVISGTKCAIKAVTVTLTDGDSGAVLVPLTSAQNFTLPAVATAGVNFTFISGHASAHVITAQSAVLRGSYLHNTNGSTLARVQIAGKTTLTLVNGVIGDTLSITSDGTSWYVVGSLNAAATQGA